MLWLHSHPSLLPLPASTSPCWLGQLRLGHWVVCRACRPPPELKKPLLAVCQHQVAGWGKRDSLHTQPGGHLELESLASLPTAMSSASSSTAPWQFPPRVLKSRHKLGLLKTLFFSSPESLSFGSVAHILPFSLLLCAFNRRQGREDGACTSQHCDSIGIRTRFKG